MNAAEWVEQTLQLALAKNASDIHMEPFEEGYQVRFRIDGQLVFMADIPSCDTGVVQRIKVLAGIDIAERRLPQDGSFHLGAGGMDVDIRVSTLPTLYGEKVVMRLLRYQSQIHELGELGMEEKDLERLLWLLEAPQGLLLVTGATGSGKTTTLYAMLRHLVKTRVSVTSLEDPIESRVPGVSQVQINDRAGLTFARGLRAVLRQDPNVIMVGEIRDEETAEIAVRASLTGHLVLSTLHTMDARGAFLRLVEFGISPKLVSAGVIGILSQKLVGVRCEYCKGSGNERLCSTCHGTGLQGRRGVFHLTVMNDELSTQFVEGLKRERSMNFSFESPEWLYGGDEHGTVTSTMEERALARALLFADGWTNELWVSVDCRSSFNEETMWQSGTEIIRQIDSGD
ncbi:GspE/PulE family protein [Collibacillus ludicampi]|nr:GspE/PulE family protein [Collibacillus ludicampi]